MIPELIRHYDHLLFSTLIAHFLSSTYHIAALCTSTITDCSPSVSLHTLLTPFYPVHQWSGHPRTLTEQVLFGWWIILSTAATLMWWWCVSVCCAGTSGSDTAVVLEFLNTVFTYCALYATHPSHCSTL